MKETKAELEMELKAWKTKKFMLAMKDHWSFEDYKKDREMFNKITELEKRLAEM